MNYVSLCKRLAVCTALGIALSLPVGAVWNTMQPQLAYAEEYSSLRGNIIENAYLLVGTPFKMGGSFPSEGNRLRLNNTSNKAEASGNVKIVYVPKPVEKKENVTADENAALQMAKAPVEVA